MLRPGDRRLPRLSLDPPSPRLRGRSVHLRGSGPPAGLWSTCGALVHLLRWWCHRTATFADRRHGRRPPPSGRHREATNARHGRRPPPSGRHPRRRRRATAYSRSWTTARCSCSTGPTSTSSASGSPRSTAAATLADVEALCRRNGRAHRPRPRLPADQPRGHPRRLGAGGPRRHRGHRRQRGRLHAHLGRPARRAVRLPRPRVEVHISDISAREAFRQHSYLTDVCDHHVVGPA